MLLFSKPSNSLTSLQLHKIKIVNYTTTLNCSEGKCMIPANIKGAAMKFLVIFLVVSFPVFAAEILTGNPCPNKNDTFQLIANKTSLFNLTDLVAILDCSSEKDLLLLANKNKDLEFGSSDGSYQVLKRIDKKSPAALLFTQADRFIAFRPSSFQIQSSVFSFFMDRAQSESCGDRYEIGYVEANVVTQSDQDVIQVETPVFLGICLDSSAESSDLPMALNVLDIRETVEESNIWPAPISRLKIVYYTNDSLQDENGSITDVNKLNVVEIDLKENKLVSNFSIAGKKFFPEGCGEYLMTARLLPESTQLALFYRSPKVVFVDLAKGDSPISSEVKYDGSGNMARTCEGYLPSYSSLRGNNSENPLDFVSINQWTRKILFPNFNIKLEKIVFTEIEF